jgi:hypothetical protein
VKFGGRNIANLALNQHRDNITRAKSINGPARQGILVFETKGSINRFVFLSMAVPGLKLN